MKRVMKTLKKEILKYNKTLQKSDVNPNTFLNPKKFTKKNLKSNPQFKKKKKNVSSVMKKN